MTEPVRTPAAFADRLCAAMDRAGTVLCVGLDPVLDRLPAEIDRTNPPAAVERFCLGVLDAIAGIAPVVKPQSACFERFGSAGVAVLERVVARARDLGLIVVLDAKRGDIGTTAEHYAAAAARMGADAITVNAYLGPDTVEPYLAAGLGVFVLVRTSNPDSDRIQSERLADGRTVGELMADRVAELGRGHLGVAGLSGVGAVVGATKAADGAALRARMPGQVFLVPGFGAQGGTAEDVRALVRPGARSAGLAGVVVNASRSVLYPRETSENWAVGVASAARRVREELAAAFGAAETSPPEFGPGV
jgi:orotidine-5'-phosphate decarboxylase